MAIAGIVLLVGVRILSNSLANVFQKRLVTAFPHPLLINAVVYVLLSVLLLPRLWFLPLPGDGEVWLWAASGGLFGALGNAFMVKALQHGELSVLGPINAWKPVIGMAGGVALLHELPSGAGIAGLGLILLGSYWILGAGSGGFHWRILLREDILYRFGALVLTALEAVFIKRVILLSSVEISFLGWCWFGALFSLAGAAVFRRRRSGETSGAFSVLRRNWFPLAALALCFGAMQFATNLVFDELPVGPALALFQLSAVVNLWFGWRFFRERDMKKKILGTIVTMIGAGLIILFC